MTPDLALRIVDLIIDDQWTAAKRREFVKLYGAMATSDAEGLARRSRGEAEPQTAADRAGKRQAWLDKVEATRRDAMKPWGGIVVDEDGKPVDTAAKPNHAAAVRCLQLEGQAEGWLGAASGKAAPIEAGDAKEDREVWLGALDQCPKAILDEYLARQKEARH